MRRGLIAVGLVLLGLGAALFFAFTRTEVRRALAQGEPVQVLLLVHTGIPQGEPGPDLALLVSLLPHSRCAWILGPGSLKLPRDGSWRTVKELRAREGPEAVGSTVAALLELPVLATLELSPSAWDAWVKELGGVVARPEERLVFQDPFRQVFIDIPAGEQLLDGPRSRALLAYLLRYHPGAPDLGGVHAFFGDFLARVQGRPEFLRQALALPGLSPWTTRDFWEGVARARPVLEVLPGVREGGEVMPDLVRIRKLREALLTARNFLTRAEVRVFLANGTRERFLATRTATWLTARGFQVVGVGQADRQDYAKSFLILGKGAEAKAELLKAVLPREVTVISAEAFGVERVGGWPEGADVVLLLGVGFDVGA